MLAKTRQRWPLLCWLAVLLATVAGCAASEPGLPRPASPTPVACAHWSVEPLTADRSVIKVEVAGSYEQIGHALGKWYRDQGHLPRPMTAAEQQTARALLAFYTDVAPGMREQLGGVYSAYGLRLDDLSHAIPVWDEEGIRILLPGLVESHSCSVIATRPSIAADGHARLARNHDWPTELTDVFVVFAAPEQGYPTVVMTRGLPGLAASDGMNAAGLALGLASVRNVGYTWAEPALPSNVAYRLVLEQCATVEEAIALLRSVPVGFVNPAPEQLISHILLADRSGDSAVLEFLPQGIIVSRTSAPYQVMTNNYWAGPADQHTCARYQTAVASLADAQGAVGADRLMAIMSSLRGTTQWTVAYDLEELSLELTLPGDGFAHHFKLFLADFVARMSARK